ncbi:MAG: MGMT family protein [Candidatus Omnitrophica bacterium]|nr:MGMT family protein [Candidatus Omnitrophota bacterium]MDD5487641.1 MGMT family protein [Candidatus Omnitrophota bacterium]
MAHGRTGYIAKIKNNNYLTGFQKKVLTAIMDIPAGEVRSYSWVARRIGSPKATRAVGGALSANPYAPMVPCHRVIRSDGCIGGYASGVARKKELLLKEGVKFGGGRMIR